MFEHFVIAWLILVWVLSDERGGFAIIVRGFEVFTPGLRDHAEAIITIVHLREPLKEILSGLLGLVELAGFD